jgi:adenylate kinase
LVHVEDEVHRVASRREADASRPRPRRTAEQLIEYQNRSVRVCSAFASALGIPLSRLRSGDESSFVEAISSAAARVARADRPR